MPFRCHRCWYQVNTVSLAANFLDRKHHVIQRIVVLSDRFLRHMAIYSNKAYLVGHLLFICCGALTMKQLVQSKIGKRIAFVAAAGIAGVTLFSAVAGGT